MNTELAAYTPHDLDMMAERVSKSGLFKMTREQAFTLMLLCQAEGLHPIEAVKRYDIIQGQPAKKAQAILAEFQARGGICKWLETGAARASALFSHPKLYPEPYEASYSMEDAKTAGLAGKDNWRKNPGDMLVARTITRGVRRVMPGVMTGIYSSEEVADFEPARATARVFDPPALEAAPEFRAPGPGDPAEPPPSPPTKADLKAHASLKKTWAVFSTDAIAATNDALHRASAEAGLPIDAAASACNIHQLHRHLAKWNQTLRSPFPAPAEGGTLQQRDIARLVAGWWDKGDLGDRGDIRAEVGRYLKLRVDACLDAAEGDGPTIDAGPGDEAAEVDEDAILAMGREPGEEG